MRTFIVLAVCCIFFAKINYAFQFPFKTQGNKIVDSAGQPVKLAGVNWYGAEEKDFIVGGLDRAPLDEIVTYVQKNGFNSVRLPFSVEMFIENPIIN